MELNSININKNITIYLPLLFLTYASMLIFNKITLLTPLTFYSDGTVSLRSWLMEASMHGYSLLRLSLYVVFAIVTCSAVGLFTYAVVSMLGR
ncbi:hypothetical protein PMI17_00612 [Pantoea sp. GM01]|nr:hypothetical protein PMI17_00612 [Pantoea sp. GM01]